MRMSRLAPLAVLAVAASLIGCGSSGSGSSAADAKAAYAPIRTQILGIGTSIGHTFEQTAKETHAALARQFEALAARARAEATALDGLDVPNAVAAARDALRDAISTGAGDLTGIATAFRASNAVAARTAAQRLVADSAAIKAARTAFEQMLTATS